MVNLWWRRGYAPTALVCLAMLAAVTAQAADRKPNILIIVADDLGYGELSCQGNPQIPTPNIDSIAKSGVRFTSAYVSAPYCSPTRAGLMTGRYQERFGHEFNPGLAGNSPKNAGLSLQETTIASRLKEAGYATGIFGKWHLGYQPEFHPMKRGFDEFFGFLGGGHDYFDAAADPNNPILQGTAPVGNIGYTTDAFGREAVSFIERHKTEPWLVYLSFNAVHAPLESIQKYLSRFTNIEDNKRRTFAAMLSAMDDAVGNVLATLRKNKLEENTLVFFFSDNGGPTPSTTSSNGPLRGFKAQTWEGGIRIPFMVQWKGQIPAGKVYDQPVIQLDILPTSLAAARIQIQPEWKLDGVNLLPYLKGENSDPPHTALYWRFGRQMAIRMGDWKLVKGPGAGTNIVDEHGRATTEGARLYNLAKDIGEQNNLADQQPAKVKELAAAWNEWNSQLQAPSWYPTRARANKGRGAGVRLGGDDLQRAGAENRPAARTGPNLPALLSFLALCLLALLLFLFFYPGRVNKTGTGTLAKATHSAFSGEIREPVPVLLGPLIAPVVAASVAVRLYGLYGRSMWFDESSSWRTIGFPLAEMFARIARNIHVPFFYVLLKGWGALFGDSIVSLRTFSPFFAAIATLGVFLFASVAFVEREEENRPDARARARWIGLVGAALFAASSYQVRLAWEIRMYSLGTALVLLSSWLLFRALRRPEPSWRAWSLYGAVTLLFAWTHHFALLSIAGQALFLAVHLVSKHGFDVPGLLKSTETRSIALAFTIVGVGWSPWLPVFLAQRDRVESGWWTGPLASSKVLTVVNEMFLSRHLYLGRQGWQIATLVACVLVIVALLYRARSADLYVAAMAVVPFFLAFYGSLGNSSIMVPRYFAFVQPFMLIAAAALLVNLPGRLLRNGLACLLVSVLLSIHLDFVNSSGIKDKTGVRGAAAYLDRNRKANEPVIASTPFIYYPLLYYTGNPTGCRVFSSTGSLAHHQGGPFSRPGEVVGPGEVEAMAPGRVWVLSSSSPWARGNAFVPPHWQPLRERRFAEWLPNEKDVLVVEYAIRPKQPLEKTRPNQER